MKIIDKIYSWFIYNSPIYINLNIWKSIKYYIKSMKVFRHPIIVRYRLINGESLDNDYYFVSAKTYNKLLHISFNELDWKIKYCNYRFEGCPYLKIVLFNKYCWIFGLEAPIFSMRYDTETGKVSGYDRNNDLYWETILEYLYNGYIDKDPIKAYEKIVLYKYVWQDDKVVGKIPETSFDMFRDKYKRKISEYINIFYVEA